MDVESVAARLEGSFVVRMPVPPGPEYRIDQLKRAAVVLAVLLAVGALFTAMQLSHCTKLEPPPSAPAPASATPKEEKDWRKSEEARLLAYDAARRYVQQHLEPAGVDTIYWRGNVHEVKGDLFLFVGFIDVVMPDGQQEKRTYRVVLNYVTKDRWDLVELEVLNADGTVSKKAADGESGETPGSK